MYVPVPKIHFICTIKIYRVMCVVLDLNGHLVIITASAAVKPKLRRPLQPPNKVDFLKWSNLLEPKIINGEDSSWVTNQLEFVKSVNF